MAPVSIKNITLIARLPLPFARVLCFMLLVCCSAFAEANNEVSGVRVWQAPDNTRIVFDLKGPVQHQVFVLAGPDRLVVDLQNIEVKIDVSRLDIAGSFINSVRGAKQNDKDYRIVFDLKKTLKPQSFVLPPNEQYGHRLVIDLIEKTKDVVKTEKDLAPQVERKGRKVIVAIDAGHGGEDPGASGPKGIKEKEIVLQISRALEKRLKKTQGITPVLTRTGDYYLSLTERPRLARKKHNADIFISIHADAFTDPRAHGASVYALSRTGATSSAARYLADKENQSDLIGGVRIDDKDSMVRNVIVDLIMEGSLEQSIYMGDRMLAEMGGVAKLHKPRVEQAAFRVLRSPDMISVLVETGFISNPAEAMRLADPAYQNKLVEAITSGLENYLKQYPVPGSYYATLKPERAKEHIITSGDTLSSIAARYGVSVNSLKQANGLSSNSIKVGQKIKIPAS